jgi:hypothetical protein
MGTDAPLRWSLVNDLASDPDWSELGQSLSHPVAVATLEVGADANDVTAALLVVLDAKRHAFAGDTPPALFLVRMRPKTAAARNLGVWGDLPEFNAEDVKAEAVRETDGHLECAGLVRLVNDEVFMSACRRAANAPAMLVFGAGARPLEDLLSALVETSASDRSFWSATIEGLVSRGCLACRVTTAHGEVILDWYGSPSRVAEFRDRVQA